MAMDQVLLATNCDDLESRRSLAEAKGLGLELQAFTIPSILANNWIEVLAEHKRLLADFSGNLAIHGAFYDMTTASYDPAIVEITKMRYEQNLHVARELDARYVVFHLNYLGLLKLPNYRVGWLQRQIDFWGSFAEEAAVAGIPIVLENSWEDDPALVVDILDEVGNPFLMACLDIAHAALYSEIPVRDWIEAFQPYLYCCHLNNHDGKLDMHWSLDQGIIDYPPILTRLRDLAHPPLLCLEMPYGQDIESSLKFLNVENLSH
jgi:sugar phosphate isomerase/epimerase